MQNEGSVCQLSRHMYLCENSSRVPGLVWVCQSGRSRPGRSKSLLGNCASLEKGTFLKPASKLVWTSMAGRSHFKAIFFFLGSLHNFSSHLFINHLNPGPLMVESLHLNGKGHVYSITNTGFHRSQQYQPCTYGINSIVWVIHSLSFRSVRFS